MDLDIIKKEFPEKPVGRAENLTGKKFGKWTVLYRTINDNGNKPKWVCQCDCKNHTVKAVSARTLKNGTSTNCGCSRLETIRKKSSQFRLIDSDGNITHKRCYSCKQMLPIINFWKNSAQLDGYTNKCKKCNDYNIKENKYAYYKKNAKKRNLSFKLTKDEFYAIIKQPCYYCGDISQNSRGIDRVNSKEGYFFENCVSCCEFCNKMKLDYSIDFWINHMKKILKNYGDKK